LACYYYTIKTNSKTICLQVGQLAPAGSSVASPKIWERQKIWWETICLILGKQHYFVYDTVEIENPERHVRKASHRGSKQQ